MKTIEDEIKNILPDGTVLNQGSIFEVNGLNSDAVPLNCTIIASKVLKDRTFYFVTTDDYALVLRICDASVNSPYAKFAVVHNFVSKSFPKYGEYVNEYRQMIDRIIWHVEAVK